ncbi:MAG: amidohydrolase [Mogibacterium sp.]|nr:amidohydrolase [Mogibacterium sp.]
MTIQTAAAKYADYVIKMRRYFHQHPELSDYEYNTAKVIREELDKIGVPWRVCGMETGTLATIKGAKPGRTIMLRGDIDALPMQEESGVEFTSLNDGVMHSCGHDCHAAMLLTAAHILNDIREDLCGTVQLAFQPSEEIAHGAAAMLEDGVLDGVDACFGIHVWADVPVGKVGLSGGPLMAGAHKFAIDITGKGGHGAQPQDCIDPIVASAAVIEAIQKIPSREIAPVQPVVITVGKIESGTSYNIIPDTAHMDGTIRCFDLDLYNALPGILEARTRDAAASCRATLEYKNRELTPPTVNDPEKAEQYKVSAAKIFGAENVIPGATTMGGEDFAKYLLEVPGALAQLGIYNEAKGCVYAQHSNHYCVDEDVLILGAMLYSQVAADFNAEI